MLRALQLALLACLVAAPLQAQTAARGGETRLTAFDGVPGDRFSISVAIDGTNAIVGAYNDDDGRGSAYAFEFDGTGWVSRGKLRASDGVAGDQFGWAVALSGDRAIITAPKDDGRGSAYGFVFNGATWAQRSKLVPQGVLEGDFGISAAVSGDRAVIGMASDGAPSIRGSAFVFVASGTAWTQQAQLTASGGAPGDNFGFSVAVSGDRLLVGAFGASSLRGSAYVFDLVSGAWVQRPSFRGAEVIPGDRFGRAVALSGDRALVGADEGGVGGNAGGAAYVFEPNGTTWVQRQRLVASDRPTTFGDRWDERFGAAVALAGDQAVIGAQFARVDPTQTSNAVERGAAYLFAFDGTWRETEKVTASDWAPNDRFGASVAITDGAALVGAFAKNGGQGAAYVYGTPEGPPTFAILDPQRDDLVASGEPYVIRFDALEAPLVDLYVAERETGERTLIAEDISGVSGVFEWDVPEDMLSPATFLFVVDAADPSREGASDRFRVRERWRLARVVGTPAEPEYELFAYADHAWQFDQSPQNMWPQPYWDRAENAYDNNVFGYDPLIAPIGQVRYDEEYFFERTVAAHPTWEAMARAFGFVGAYASAEPWEFSGITIHQINNNAVERWRLATAADGTYFGEERSYGGLCYGMSKALMAAFASPAAFGSRWLPSTGADYLAEVPLSDEVRDALHSLYTYQFGRAQAEQNYQDVAGGITPRDVLADLKIRFESDNRGFDRHINFRADYERANGTIGHGGHAVAPIAMERLREGVYAVVVFDPNYGPGNANIEIDSTANAWAHFAPGGEPSSWIPRQGGGLYLSTLDADALGLADPNWPVVFSEPVRPLAARSGERARGGPAFMDVRIAGGDSGVEGAAGEVSYRSDLLTETLPGGVAVFPYTGTPSRPLAYLVPPGRYTADVAPGTSGTAMLDVGDRLVFGFERTGAEPGAPADVARISPDALALAPGTDGQIRLVARVTVGSMGGAVTRTFAADHLGVVPGQEATVSSVADSTGFRVASAVETQYNLVLGQAGGGGRLSFYHADVPLVAGATHTIRPDWVTLGDGPVTVEVDLDGDGTTDQTMTLQPQPFPVAGEPGPAPLSPEAFAVRAYPNPVRGRTTVEVATPEAGAVRVVLVDLLGREVAELHAGPLAAGVHPFALGTSRLPAGIYVVRAMTAEAVVTQRVTVVR